MREPYPALDPHENERTWYTRRLRECRELRNEAAIEIDRLRRVNKHRDNQGGLLANRLRSADLFNDAEPDNGAGPHSNDK